MRPLPPIPRSREERIALRALELLVERGAIPDRRPTIRGTIMHVSLTALSRDEGTVVMFTGRDDDGCPVSVVVEHRMARAIREALLSGPVTVTVEPWQVSGHAEPSGWPFGGPAA